jgi:hypothetical protein
LKLHIGMIYDMCQYNIADSYDGHSTLVDDERLFIVDYMHGMVLSSMKYRH